MCSHIRVCVCESFRWKIFHERFSVLLWLRLLRNGDCSFSSMFCRLVRKSVKKWIHECQIAIMQGLTAVLSCHITITTRWQTCLNCTQSYIALQYNMSRPHNSLRICMQEEHNTSIIAKFWLRLFLWVCIVFKFKLLLTYIWCLPCSTDEKLWPTADLQSWPSLV